MAAPVVLPASAVGQADTPDDVSGIDQYSESLPAAEGGRTPGVAGGKTRRAGSLSGSVARALAGGRDSRLIGRIATDPALGAPAAGGAGGSERKGGSSGARGGLGTTPGVRASSSDDPGLASSVASAITSSDLLGVILGMLAVVVAGAALALRRRRRAGQR